MIKFSQADFETFCIEHRVTSRTRAYIDAGFGAPARRVRPGKKNSKSTVPCPKMGFVLVMESNLERANVLNHLFDDDVIGYLEQPLTRLHLAYRRTNGKRTRSTSVVDCMVFHRTDGLILEEVKPWSKLVALAEADPVRYRMEGDRITSPIAEEAASSYGARFRIVTDRCLPAVRSQNHQFLFDYAAPGGCPSATQLELLTRAFNGLACQPGIAFEGLDRDILFGAVAHGHVFIDFDRVRLAKPNRTMFYRTAEARDALVGVHRAAAFSPSDQDLDNAVQGDRLDLDGSVLTIVLVTDTQVFVTDDEMKAITFERSVLKAQLQAGKACLLDGKRAMSKELATASHEDMREAQRRLLMINGEEVPPHLDGGADQVSSRTLRTWRAAYRTAIADGRDPLLALLPRRHARGNRVSRIAPDEQAFLQAHIDSTYLRDNAMSIRGAHASYRIQAAEAGLVEVSIESYRLAVGRRDIKAVAEAREGSKSAQNVAAFDEFAEPSPDRHGQYPMDVVHIDHTIVDVQAISSQTDERLETARPTLTLAIDGFTRAIVGMFISLEKPGKKHVLACITDIVRRRRRLPTTIVVDGGSEFYSEDVESTMAFYGVCIRSREGKPRSGNVIERAFGITNDQFLHELVGTTKLSRNVRLLTPQVDPQNLACIPVVALMEGLEEYWFEIFNKTWRKHSHFMTADAAFRKGIRDSGGRKHRPISFDKDFLIRMLPTIESRISRRVDPQRGFTLDYDVYNHPCFYGSRGDMTVSQIKVNPWDPSSVFAWFQNGWIECVCRVRRDQMGDSPIDRRALFEERPLLVANVRESHDVATTRIVAVVESLNAHRFRDPLPTNHPEVDGVPSPVVVEVQANEGDGVGAPVHVGSEPLRVRPSLLPTLSGKSWREVYR